MVNVWAAYLRDGKNTTSLRGCNFGDLKISSGELVDTTFCLFFFLARLFIAGESTSGRTSIGDAFKSHNSIAEPPTRRYCPLTVN